MCLFFFSEKRRGEGVSSQKVHWMSCDLDREIIDNTRPRAYRCMAWYCTSFFCLLLGFGVWGFDNLDGGIAKPADQAGADQRYRMVRRAIVEKGLVMMSTNFFCS